MKILFFGTPYFAKNVLEVFLNDNQFEIVGLVTQEDKPFGRKKELKMPETKELLIARKSEIPIYQPSNLVEFYNVMKNLTFDVILVVAYGRILPKEIVEQYFCLNIHASILPKYRGASPIQEMILNNETFVGVSIIKMTQKLDDGDIMGISYIKNKSYNIIELTSLLSQMGAKLAKKVLVDLGFIKALLQIDADSSYCVKITKNRGLIDFQSAESIYYKALAYQVWPQIFLDSGLKLFDIVLYETQSCNRAGEILAILEDCIIVGCTKGSLKIGFLQEPSKTKINAVAYLRGKRLGVGDMLCKL